MSQNVSLAGAVGVPLSQVEGLIGQTRSVRKVQLDELYRSHNLTTRVQGIGPSRGTTCPLSLFPPGRRSLRTASAVR